MGINQAAFNDPQNWMRAEGVNLNTDDAFVSTNGAVLFYAKTGGMMFPKRHPLEAGTTLYRFGGSSAATEGLLTGSWWIDQTEFNKLMSFAQQHDIGVGLAMRALALIPPQWSDMGKLVRVTVRAPLLAMRGLGESVRVDMGDGLGDVRMPHYNSNPARRLFQLFIPGLRAPGMAQKSFIFGNVYTFDPEAATKGFIYT